MTGARRAALSAVVALALVVSSLAAPAALAAPSAAAREARRHFDEAELSYRAGHYAEALAKYQAGYAAVPLPGFLVNIAQCQRRLGDLKTARATYREFVLVAPDSRLVPEVETLIKELDTLIADLASGGPGETTAQLGAGAGQGAEVHATDPDAPPPSLVAAAPTETPVLIANPAPLATETPRPRSHARWWIWGGIAAAAVVGGVATGIALSSPGTATIRAGSLGTLTR
jgi:tetratricopeptide (TPR) repeat protein